MTLRIFIYDATRIFIAIYDGSPDAFRDDISFRRAVISAPRAEKLIAPFQRFGHVISSFLRCRTIFGH